MPTSVRVHDYYDNDENGLWSWYLKNIRSGDFEELTSNKLKYTLLKRFLNAELNVNNTDNNTANNDINKKNQKILLVSIPDKVHSDILILETFLKDYFHLEDLENIKIQKLTKDHCYNHENHYLLTDSLNNFNDPTFLNYINPSLRKQQEQEQDEIIKNKKKNKVNSHINYTDDQSESINGGSNTSNSNFDPTNNDYCNSNNFNEMKSTNSSSMKSSSESPINTQYIIKNEELLSKSKSQSRQDIEINQSLDTTIKSGNMKYSSQSLNTQSTNNDDVASSIVLNFPRATNHIRHLPTSTTSIPSNNMLQTVLNGNTSHFSTPPDSELVSINSYYNEYDNNANENIVYNDDDDEDARFIKRQHATSRISTNSDLYHNSNNNSNTNSLSLNENAYNESERAAATHFSQDKTHRSNLPEDITEETIENEELNSIPEEDNMSLVSSVSSGSYSGSFSSTASSSTSSALSSASSASYYSILPSISINDTCGHYRLVLQSGLFYNNQKEIHTAIRQSNNIIDVATVKDDWILYDSEFSMNNLMMLTLKELFDIAHETPKILFYSMVIVNDKPEEIIKKKTEESPIPQVNDIKDIPDDILDEENLPNNNPEGLYDDNYDEPQMYVPQRMISNTTTAHRSIRTVNSIGEWAYKKKSNATSAADNESYASEDRDYDGYEHNNIDNGSNANEKSLGDQNENNTIKPLDSTKKSNNVHSMQAVERWKSLPNKMVSNNNEAKKWKLKMKKFKKSTDERQKDKDAFCNIM